MKNVLKTMTLLALAAVIALPLSAQEKKKKKGDKGRNPLAATVAKVKEAGADEATLEKVEALAKEYGPKVAEANKGLGDALKQRADARKAAAAEGKKGKDAQAAVDAVKLTDEQKAALAQSEELQKKFKAAVAALLTPEQAKAAGVAAGKGGGDKKKKKKTDE